MCRWTARTAPCAPRRRRRLSRRRRRATYQSCAGSVRRIKRRRSEAFVYAWVAAHRSRYNCVGSPEPSSCRRFLPRVFLLGRHQAAHRRSPGCALRLHVLHLAGNVLIFARAGHLQRVLAHADLESADRADRDRPAARLPAAHLQGGHDVAGEPGGAAGRLRRRRSCAGHTSRKSLASSTMIASGLFLLLFIVVHVKQFKFGAFYLTAGSDAVRDLYRTEIEVFRNPLWVAVLRDRHAARRPAPAARDLERVPVARRSTIRSTRGG